MGLISYFQNLYYENRLKKADRLLREGSSSEAEEIYASLVDKHPLAASRLGEYYFSLSPNEDIRKDIALFKKTVDLKRKGAGIYDVNSFETILLNYIDHIKTRANKCFNEDSFDECLSLTTALKETNNSTKDIDVLFSEAKVRLLINKMNSTKITDSNFKSLISDFKQEWASCYAVPRTQNAVSHFCQTLIGSKRFYACNILFNVILDDNHDKRILDNVVNIVKGRDSEATPSIIKSVVSTYGKQIVLRKGLTIEDAVSIFETCWSSAKDGTVVMDILQNVKDASLKKALISSIFQKHKSYLSSSNLFKSFTKWLYGSFDFEESIKLLEKVKSFGYDVEDYIVNKTHSCVSKMSIDERLQHLNHAQSLYPNSAIIINDKLACAQQYLDSKNYEKAIAVSDSIITKCEKAKLIKAQALCNLANSESDRDRKVNLLYQSKDVLKSYNGQDSKIIYNIYDILIQTAEQYYQENEKDKAYAILKDIANDGYIKAGSLIAHFRLNEVRLSKTNEEKEKAASDAINEMKGFCLPSIIEDADYRTLWEEKIDSLITISKGLDDLSAVNKYETILNDIDSIRFSADVSKKLKESVVKELIRRKYLIARELEKKSDLSAALNLYKEINVLEAKRTPTLSAIRYIICKLKMQNTSDVLLHREHIYSLLRRAATSYKAEKDDIAYRFALILLKSGEDQEALSVLSEFLPDEEYLKKACEQGAILKALAKLEDFNNKLESAKNKTLSSDDAVYFINHMLEYADVIKPVLDIPRSTLSKYRNKLKNYAIFKLFDEERYDVAFDKMMKEHKDFLDDYTALRNIALICLNMAEANQVTINNYKDVISIWLTAIYQEKLFVKSLDYTSWDDPFTFSLYDAYGHFDDNSLGTLPDNVNNDYSEEDNVVLIKEVQRALLDRFEAAISNNQQYHEFFTSQKEAMDSFIALNLDYKCRLVAPNLAHNDDELFHDISEALEQDRLQEYDNWEDVLSVGVIYQMPQTIYSDYSKAKSYYSDCINTINTLNNNNAKYVFSSAKIELIKRFRKMSSALYSYSNSKVSALSAKDKLNFNNNFNFYLVVCSSLKDNTLSFMFSNYVMQYVVGEVNSDAMKKTVAADYILSIYSLDKNNSKVKENLTTLFEILVRDNSSESSRAVTKILDKIKTFDVSLYNQLNKINEHAKVDKELEDIVERLTKKKVLSESAALDRVYTLYSNHPDNDAVCEILAQLCVACIMKFIIYQEYGGSSVSSILNRLENNMSPTFKKHRKHFKDAYDALWNNLPYSTQVLLDGGSRAELIGQTLNEKGRALQRGLDYFKSLGGFSSSSSSRFGFRSSVDLPF